MLRQFSFENFKSFKDEATLDFIAESISEHKEHLIIEKADNESVLPVVVIYGPNGGGKSTVLEALNFLSAVILNKIIALKINLDENEQDSGQLKKILNTNPKDKYHKFDKSYHNKPIKFDLLFKIKNQEFKYQLSIIHNEISEENLYAKIGSENDARIIFERDAEDCYLGEELQGITVDKVKSSMPLLAYIAISHDVEIIDSVVEWFFSIQYLDYDNPKLDKRILFPKDKEKQKILFDMFKEMDINIVDFRLEEDLEGNIIEVFTKHQLPNGENIEIPFTEESSGTRKLFGFLPEIIRCLEQGNLLIADEMDAKLHPKLIKYIIELFTNSNSNKNGAQLLMTSHDMYTLTPEVLRRDEIWFCAINQDNASKLYPLVTFKKESGIKPRNDESYNKQYMEGRYGADPYLRKILDWGKKM